MVGLDRPADSRDHELGSLTALPDFSYRANITSEETTVKRSSENVSVSGFTFDALGGHGIIWSPAVEGPHS